MSALSFYIASSRDELDTVRLLAATLTAAGMRDNFPWPAHFDHVCAKTLCGVDGRLDLKRHEVRGASTCDIFVGLARMGKGSHVELGCVLVGRAQLILLVGVDEADSVFYTPGGFVDMPPVVVVPTVEAALRVLL